MVSLITCFVLGIMAYQVDSLATQKQYGMYVWSTGWDPEVSSCNETAFLEWKDGNVHCFTHTYNTPLKRQWLWNTCKRTGREITRLFLYDTHTFLTEKDCQSEGVLYLKETIHEGKNSVQNLEIYALFSDGGEHVPESRRVSDIVWYNDMCATSDGERIDGIAVNNEDYDRTWPDQRIADYFDNLEKVKIEAGKQVGGLLPVHYSVGWIWGRGSDGDQRSVPWKGANKYIMHHFIDIFDSLDVQVAFVKSDTMISRMKYAGWDYAVSNNKPMFATVYINKSNSVCQTTFFPAKPQDSSCPSWALPYKTESRMFEELDKLESGLPSVRPVLHYFRGAYSSGGNSDWPAYK